VIDGGYVAAICWIGVALAVGTLLIYAVSHLT
jgi:hypothetical protein